MANAGGSLVSTLRYTAFGEIRATSGATNTDYRYTGQREESELGLYFYVARFYDPALGRFIQADTIVPGVGNPMAWDRYAYVQNNPVNFSDPTGHDADCGLQERCRLSTVNEFTRVIKQTYKIKISKSASFNLKEMKTIYNALGSMEAGINGITNGSGLSWINNKFTGTTISRTPSTIVENIVFHGNSHVGGSTIYLADDFANQDWMSLDGKAGSMIIHEFGHVVDNRSRVAPGDASLFGGGAGDQLMNYINAKSNGLFGNKADGGIFYGKNPFPGYNVQWPSNGTANYGNNSTADYFANTFAAMVTSYEAVPQPSGMWMASFIDLTK